MARNGKLEYGARAFQQDAQNAMRGDVVRALIELITNADDAYGDAEGQIFVRVSPTKELDLPDLDSEAFPLAVLVQDAAGGLDAEGMFLSFTKLGGENLQFQEGDRVRGLFGRGAKDVAVLGQAQFHAIKDDKYSRIILDDAGGYSSDPEDQPATATQREALRLNSEQSGLTAVVLLRRQFEASVPRPAQIADRLKDHAQLRHLLRRQQVFLIDDRRGGQPIVLEPRPERGETVFDGPIEIKGYGEAHLKLRKLPEPAKGGLSEHSEHGVLISGTNATYENTLFGLDGRPEASQIAGELVAPQIELLIREFDGLHRGAEAPTSNAIRLVSRDRDGLVKEHGFYKAMRQAVLSALLPLLNEMAAKRLRERKPGEKLRNAFDAARIALAKQVNEVLSELEDDPAGPGFRGPVLADLAIIPPRLVIKPGEERTVTLRMAGDQGKPYTAKITSDGEGQVVAVIDASQVFKPHARLDAVSAVIRIKAADSFGEAQLHVSNGDAVATAEISVVAPGEEVEPDVAELEFERNDYKVAPSRKRHLVLRGPIALAESLCTVHLEGQGEILSDTVTLVPSPNGRYSTATISYQAPSAPAQVTIVARVEKGVEASTRVTVQEHAPRQGIDLEFELDPNAKADRRGRPEDLGGVLKVWMHAEHPTLKRALGPYNEEMGRYEHEDSALARAVMAEVIAGVLSGYLVEREAVLRPALIWDPAKVLATNARRSSRLVEVAQRVLEESA